ERDGRIALYLTDHLPLLRIPTAPELTELEERIVSHLRVNGASFFAQLQLAVGGFTNDVVDALWSLVWKGVITNDTFHALRSFTRKVKSTQRTSVYRSRRTAVPASTQGRWSLLQAAEISTTQRA